MSTVYGFYGETGVKLKIYMIAIGQNIRKYHRRKIENKKKMEKLLSLLKLKNQF